MNIAGDFTPHPPLVLRDGPDTLRIGFDDLLKYHGCSSIGGVAIAFRVMAAAFERLSQGFPLDRRSITVLTAFPGPGAADAFEMVTRCRSDGRYRVDTDLDVPQAAAAAKGRYFFQFSAPHAVCGIGLREGIVFAEFIELLQRGAQSPLNESQSTRLAYLKMRLAERVLGLSAEALFVPGEIACPPTLQFQ